MKKLLLFAVAALSLTACSDDDASVARPRDKYQGGFYVLNEGQANASVNYWDGKAWQLNVYQTNNNGETLGMTGVSAVCTRDNMYIVSKMAPFLVEVGLADFVRKSQLGEDAVEGQARNFALLDDERGVLTTTEGAYEVSLNPLALRKLIYEGSDLWGDVAVCDGHIFFTTTKAAGNVVKVVNATTYEFEKELGAAQTGFVWASGSLWTANAGKLLKIDTSKLTAEQIELPGGVEVFYNQFAATPTCLHATRRGDALYFANIVTEGYNIVARDVYKYTISTDALSKIFTAPEKEGLKYDLYGACINVNPSNGDLYLLYKRDGWGDNSLYNDIYVTDANGNLKESIPYTRADETVYWFPSMVIFR